MSTHSLNSCGTTTPRDSESF